MVQLSVKKDAWAGEKKLDSFLTLDTNLTSVRIPLLAFDGKLQSVSFDWKFSNGILCFCKFSITFRINNLLFNISIHII